MVLGSGLMMWQLNRALLTGKSFMLSSLCEKALCLSVRVVCEGGEYASRNDD